MVVCYGRKEKLLHLVSGQKTGRTSVINIKVQIWLNGEKWQCKSKMMVEGRWNRDKPEMLPLTLRMPDNKDYHPNTYLMLLAAKQSWQLLGRISTLVHIECLECFSHLLDICIKLALYLRPFTFMLLLPVCMFGINL